MKIKGIIILIVSFILVIGLGVLGYFGIDSYLNSRFAPNTWVQGIYCTGRTVEDVNQELLKDLKAPIISVVDAEGNSFEINLAEANYQFDYSDILKVYQKSNAENGWVRGIGNQGIIDLGLPSFSYDREKVQLLWQELPFVRKEAKVTPVVEMKFTDAGYVLESNLNGHLDSDKGLACLLSAIDNRLEKIDLSIEDCYFDYQMDEEQKKLYEKWLTLKEKEKCGLVLDMGAEKIAFDEGLMGRFIAKDDKDNPLYDETGNLYYDQTVVETFMADLCESYHTFGVPRDFMTSKGELIQVKGVTYGTELNAKKEISFVWDYVSNEETRLLPTVHMPEYLHETPVHGLNDIGDTYIEVDMGDQKIYFYKEGELLVSSDVVTGNLRNRHDTPEGVNYIYGKAKNKILRGPGYASFVRYWMPVVKAIGLHDANWRSEFGGDIYKTNGSHGCVNLPDDTADIIWDNAEIGTPVIMFY